MALAKPEHQESWLGKLVTRGVAYPGVTNPGLLAFFNREESRLVRARNRRTSDGQSRGFAEKRAHSRGGDPGPLVPSAPVSRLSASVIDMALSAGAPIVPVPVPTRGLPIEDVAERLDFPVGYGRQDLHFGSPNRTRHPRAPPAQGPQGRGARRHEHARSRRPRHALGRRIRRSPPRSPPVQSQRLRPRGRGLPFDPSRLRIAGVRRRAACSKARAKASSWSVRPEGSLARGAFTTPLWPTRPDRHHRSRALSLRRVPRARSLAGPSKLPSPLRGGQSPRGTTLFRWGCAPYPASATRPPSAARTTSIRGITSGERHQTLGAFHPKVVWMR